LRRLARLGAVARLEQLREEEAGSRAEFPELFGGQLGGVRGTAKDAEPKARRRRPMSAAQRKEVSQRMWKYWAERRKAISK
jgi:hypothetical protein